MQHILSVTLVCNSHFFIMNLLGVNRDYILALLSIK